MSCTYGCLRNVINLGNSIIGVSILAMPYCFQKCGILLSLLLIILSGILVRTACYLLLKGAVMARRRNFEFLAFHTMGSSGKLAVEIGVIGFLIGVCIAFFVVIGDLGPPLASEYFMVENTSNLRAEVLVFLGVFVALPLGLLRKVDSLTSLSFLSIAFYVCLIFKIFVEASSKFISKNWIYEVNWWDSDGFLPCLPIFSMALSCQTQLFEFFDTLSEPSIKRMANVVTGAVGLCSSVYIAVGFFGYIAYHDKMITGNVLVNMTPSVVTEFIKFGFIVTVVISFPLCLFPCRTSLHSLLFKQGLGHHDIAVNFIPDYRFRALTIGLVVITVGISIMLPNIEFVLSIIGSTIGSMICFIFPAIIFMYDTNKNISEKRVAQFVLFAGMFILVACTYSTLKEGTSSRPKPLINEKNLILPYPGAILEISHKVDATVSSLSPDIKNKGSFSNNEADKILVPEAVVDKINEAKGLNEKRHEPPQPQEPEKIEKVAEQIPDIDPQALQKEDKEIQKESLGNGVIPLKIGDNTALKDKQELLIRQLQEQQKEQQIIIQQQKQVLEELKMHKEIHDEVEREKVLKRADIEKRVPLQESALDSVKSSSLLNKKSFPKIENHKMDTAKKKIIQVVHSSPTISEKNVNHNILNNELHTNVNIQAEPDFGSQNILNTKLKAEKLSIDTNGSPLSMKNSIIQVNAFNNHSKSQSIIEKVPKLSNKNGALPVSFVEDKKDLNIETKHFPDKSEVVETKLLKNEQQLMPVNDIADLQNKIYGKLENQSINAEKVHVDNKKPEMR